MKTANGINIAEKTKTPMRKALEYFEDTIRQMQESFDNGDTTFSLDEIMFTKIHRNLIKRLLHEEKEIINEAYEDGNCDGQSGEYNSGYFELNFES